jgi:hypothetical protein
LEQKIMAHVPNYSHKEENHGQNSDGII